MVFLIIGMICAQETRRFSKRQQGGGLLIVWAAFGFHDKINVSFPSDRISALTYQDLLEENLLSFAEEIGGPFWIFHLDNTSIHTANSTWEWFLNNGVHLIPGPSVSPDLNPMENVWSLLVRAVYANGKRYQQHLSSIPGRGIFGNIRFV